MQVLSRPPSGWPALVLNADYPAALLLSAVAVALAGVIKAVFLDRVDVVSTYDQVVHSPSFEMRLPSVVSLKQYVAQDRPPAFTRFNLFLRDAFTCQYCGRGEDLTFDHVIPRSRGGRTTWENIVTACARCNLTKGGRTPREARMHPRRHPAPPDHVRAAGPRPPLPAAPPARKLARLPLLGHRAGGLVSVAFGLTAGQLPAIP